MAQLPNLAPLAAGLGLLALAAASAPLLAQAPAATTAATPAATTAATTGTATTPPAGEGLDLINERCRYCHAPAQIFAKRHTPEEWGALVQIMVDRGAEVSPEEAKTITDYLIANFPQTAKQ